MKSILLQLYDGEIHPAEQYIPKSEEYWKMRREHCHRDDEFIAALKKLEPPLHERFIEITNEQIEESFFENSSMFMNGFRLGVRMIVEVYQNNLSDAEE